MNKFVLAALVASLTLAPAAPAQSCPLAAYDACLTVYPAGDWLALALQGYCAFVLTFLCDAGL